MINFGDSLSDVGNDYKTTFGIAPGSPGYSAGRFTNGNVWLQDLAPQLGLGTVTASLNGGNDYAYGGVTSGTGSTYLVNTPVSLFPVPNVQSQIQTWTAGNKATSTELFTVLGGANDLFADIAGGTATPQQAADNIAAGVRALYADGAKTILVANLPALGQVPAYYGTVAQPLATADTVLFDNELASQLAAISTASPGLKIDNLDLYTLFGQVIRNPSMYGLSDVHDQAYTGDTSFSGQGTVVAADPSKYLFWDDVHPTAAGHTLIAQAAYAVVVPEPASVAMVIGAMIPVLGRRSRREKPGV